MGAVRTLVVMARWPASGRCKSRLAAELGPGRAATIQNRLMGHTLAVAREARGRLPFELVLAGSGLGRRALGKELDRDIIVTEPQRGRYSRRGVLGGSRPAEQHTSDERKHPCSEVSDRKREGSCVVHG